MRSTEDTSTSPPTYAIRDIEIDEGTRAFIQAHRLDDVRQLALRGTQATGKLHVAAGMPFVLDQIQGWQTARKKLPSWAATDGIVYPPHINMEQCSSEKTALYKAERIACLAAAAGGDSRLVDLTGGFGVDFAFMAQRCAHAVHVERDGRLSAIASHNFKTLGLGNVEAVCGDGVEFLHSMPSVSGGSTQGQQPFTIIYIDPARRGDHGQRVFGIADCTPDVLAMKDELLIKANAVMLKLSPMLDWHAAVKAFGHSCREVHIVSVGNECKELLLLLSSQPQGNDEMAQSYDVSRHVRVVCVNDGQRFEATVDLRHDDSTARLVADDAESLGRYLYVPNASAMKSGLFAHFTEVFPVSMLSRDTHLFVSDTIAETFPGRRFVIDATTTMSKQDLRLKLKGIARANVAVRNFPLSADALKKRLKLQDGGDTFIFGTTLRGKHILFITHIDITKSHITHQ